MKGNSGMVTGLTKKKPQNAVVGCVFFPLKCVSIGTFYCGCV